MCPVISADAEQKSLPRLSGVGKLITITSVDDEKKSPTLLYVEESSSPGTSVKEEKKSVSNWTHQQGTKDSEGYKKWGKKYGRSQTSKISLELSNRFEILNTVQGSDEINGDIEELKDENSLTNLNTNVSRKNTKDFSRRSKRNKDKFIKVKKQENKMQKDSKPIKCSNRFQLLEDKEEDEPYDLIHTLKIQQTPRHKLKKCRKCNYKKRTCEIDSSKCKSNVRDCYACHKHGHFPKSMNCKKRKKSSIRKKEINDSAPTKISKKNLKLIKKKITEIEMFIIHQKDLASQLDMFQKKFEVQMIPNCLLPFLLMYLYLNYEYIFPKNIVKKRRKDKDLIYFCAMEAKRRKKIRK